MENLNYISKKKLVQSINEVEITPSETAKNNVCSTKKICDEQGPITFGQLRELVEKGKLKRIALNVGEGSYKATLRLLPWFIPQLAIAGFAATWVRVANKLFRPTLEETTSYKTWWGKTILKIFDLVEGEINTTDPLSRIFFISDGLMTMLNDRYKVEFARYIADLASEKNDTDIVPEYFVENELRHFLNEKFFLDPPLPPKKVNYEDKKEENLTEIFTIIKKKVLMESYSYDSLVRQIVKDIVTIYKRESDGEFYLPEDLEEEENEYYLKNIAVTIELIIETSEDVENFLINGDYYSDDDVVIIKIIYNPNKKLKILYDLIGELNELLAHELRHNYQKNTGMFRFGVEPQEEEGYKYYTKPKEIDAQYYGFKRMAKITGKPFNDLVVNWFKNNKDIHQMNDSDVLRVIRRLLSYTPKT